MPIDERGKPYTEERGLHNEGSAESSTPDSRELDSSDESQMIENAARLDEIESLLHELSSEFRPTMESAEPHEAHEAHSGEPDLSLGSNADETVRLPAADKFELNKPADYDPNPERYDHRRGGDYDSYSMTAQSMARRLAPAQNKRHNAPFDEMTSQSSHSTPSPETDLEPRLEPSRQPKRRMRLRPARRVSGSRPEPRIPLPASTHDGSYDPAWSPGHAAPGRSGRRLAIGTAMTVLIIGGAAATFGMVTPMKSLLPERLAGILEDKSSAPDTIVPDQSRSTETALVTPKKESASFAVASGPADAPESAPQNTVALVEPPPAQTTSTPEKAQPPAIAQPPARVPETDTKLANVTPTQDEQVVTGDKVKKSSSRLTQDTVVQATPDKPDNSAAQSRLVQERTNKEADLVVTGSVAGVGTQLTEPASTDNQTEFRIRTVKTKPVTGQSVRIADRVERETAVSGANAYAPPSPDVSENVPFPGTQTAERQTQTARLTPESEIAPEQSVGPNPLKGIDGLLARGHDLLKSGHIASARLLFRRVASMGDERGAKGMGMTFDPDVYATLPVAGVTPDRERAEFWYRKASELARHKRIPDAGETDARSVDNN